MYSQCTYRGQAFNPRSVQNVLQRSAKSHMMLQKSYHFWYNGGVLSCTEQGQFALFKGKGQANAKWLV